jgi:hypothetical protein
MHKILSTIVLALTLALALAVSTAPAQAASEPCATVPADWSNYEESWGVTFVDPQARCYVTLLERTVGWVTDETAELRRQVEAQRATIAQQDAKIARQALIIKRLRHRLSR